MTNHRDLNAPSARSIRSLCPAFRFGYGLEDHAQFLAELLGNNPPGKAVQCHKAIGQLQRAKRWRWIIGQILIDICAAELKDERARGMARLEAMNRFGTAPGMDSDHC